MSETTNSTNEDVFTSLFPNPSLQLKTVLTYLRGIMKQDSQQCLSTLTEDHKYEWIAQGFDSLGPRIKDLKQTQAFMNSLFGNWVKNYQYEVKDYIEMPGKIMFQLKCSSELLTGTGNYDNEYVWIFHLTSGPDPKISVAKEFFDSLYASKFFGANSTAADNN